MTAVTINQERRLFVIPCAGGFSCLGFDVVFNRLKQYSSFLGLTQPDFKEIGLISQYEQYVQVEGQLVKLNPNQTWFEMGTPDKVKQVLEQYRISKKRLRLFYGNPETGKGWNDEHDVLGTVGRSTGSIKIPLLIEKKASRGGSAILCENILRIVDASTKQEVYRNPVYKSPAFEIEAINLKGFTHSVSEGGQLLARFKTQSAAEKWVEFMSGNSMRH